MPKLILTYYLYLLYIFLSSFPIIAVLLGIYYIKVFLSV